MKRFEFSYFDRANTTGHKVVIYAPTRALAIIIARIKAEKLNGRMEFVSNGTKV